MLKTRVISPARPQRSREDGQNEKNDAGRSISGC